jgi:hypothetical protein
MLIAFRRSQIYNWKPEPYNSTDDLPEDMPRRLREHIANVSITEPEKVAHCI